MIGKNIKDQARIEAYLWSTQNLLLKMVNVSMKPTDTVEELLADKEKYWESSMNVVLRPLEDSLRPNCWFLDYLTLVDFDIYEVMGFVKMLFPKKVPSYPHLLEIHQRVAQLAPVKQYNQSERCRNICFLPVEMCKKFKESSGNK